MRLCARILVVEDDHVVARDIGEQLTRFGHAVVGITSRSQEALTLAQAERPDLILMDVRLDGEMDGIEIAKRILASFRIPIIFLTAYADDETIQRASAAEPFGYLLKPFEDLQLRTAIEMALHRHWADKRLRESERRYEATLSSIAEGIIAVDDEGRITFMNPSAETMTGWTSGEALGRPADEVYCCAQEGAESFEPMDTLRPQGRDPDPTKLMLLISRDGSLRPIQGSAAPILSDEGDSNGLVIVFSDISKRIASADAIRRSQLDVARVARATTMGQLTATIAHEVTQPLMAISMNSEACVRWLNLQNVNEARAAATRTIKEADRAGQIISRIRSIARNAPVTFDRLDLNEMVQGVIEIVKPELLRHNVALEMDLQRGGASVVGDRVLLQQVIHNLISNALDAITCSEQASPLLVARTRTGNTGEVTVAIEDTGCGIESDVIDRVFEPFFTTKKDGIGMGLAICRSIIDAHRGSLWREPLAPQGSRFAFSLPQCQL